MQSRLLNWKSYTIACLSLQCGLVSAQQNSDGLLEEMKQLSRETIVSVKPEEGKQEAKLILTPVFRYSDQERKIVDASLWAWVHDDRLVALQKIEATNRLINQPRWTYCFASFTSTPLEVRWPNGDRFETKGPEVKFHDLPKAPTPSEKPFVRLQQMKQMGRRFTATISNGADLSDSNNMRLFPKPVFLHPEQPELPKLVVFGLSAFGTNPDAYLLLQAEADGEGLKWTYALRRMTTGAVKVKLDTDMVWEMNWIKPVGGPVGKEGWKFFKVSRKQD